jgi:hypothetical protein
MERFQFAMALPSYHFHLVVGIGNDPHFAIREVNHYTIITNSLQNGANIVAPGLREHLIYPFLALDRIFGNEWPPETDGNGDTRIAVLEVGPVRCIESRSPPDVTRRLLDANSLLDDPRCGLGRGAVDGELPYG